MQSAPYVGVAIEREQALPATSAEAVLVAELRAGSEEAFGYLLGIYQNPVFNLISHLLGNDADAADVLQEVFVKVFKGIGQFRGACSLKTWICRIAVHEACNHRRSWLRRRLRETFSLDSDAAEPEAASAQSRDTPYQLLEQSERQAWVRRALASLAQPYRTVVILRDIEDLSYEEIAHVLGVAEGTVKSRLARGRELLKRKLGNALW